MSKTLESLVSVLQEKFPLWTTKNNKIPSSYYQTCDKATWSYIYMSAVVECTNLVTYLYVIGVRWCISLKHIWVHHHKSFGCIYTSLIFLIRAFLKNHNVVSRNKYITVFKTRKRKIRTRPRLHYILLKQIFTKVPSTLVWSFWYNLCCKEFYQNYNPSAS